MKKILQILIVLVIIVAAGAGILFAFDKIFHTNSFEDIKNSISQIISQTKQEEPEEEVDQTPMEVSLNSNTITVLEATVALTLKANKEVSIEENTRTNLIFVKNDVDNETQKKIYLYALELKNIGVGDSTINAIIKDKSGQSKTLPIVVTRQNSSLPFGMKSIEPWPDYKYTVDGDNLKAQVNKTKRLTNDYVPKDLKNLNTDYLLYTNTATILMQKEAADYLSLMLKDLNKDTGKNAVIASGYRSYNEQYTLYAGWVRQLGQEEADKVSARPGFSEHQLGTVVDFIDQETGLNLTNNFEKGTAGNWILQNSFKYGFIQSYPEGKEETTGYSHEAWHYRYIGIDNAKAAHESGLTLKEWLEQNP